MVPPDEIKPGFRGNRPRLGGHGALKPRTAPLDAPPQPQTPVATRKKRVLFVCIGNSCRSQMAEAFARAYGADIMEVQSAGVSPAPYIAPLTK